MAEERASRWDAVERWSGTAFLVSGGLLVVSTSLKGLVWFAGVAVPAELVALFALPGLTAAVLGLFGLYPRLAERAARLSLVALGVAVAAGVTAVVNYGWVLLSGLLPAVGVAGIPEPPAVAPVALVAALAVGFGLFGAASLYTRAPSRPVGALLLAFAVTWTAVVGVGVVYGAGAPDGLYLLVYALQPLVLLTTGRALGARPEPGRHRTPTGEMTRG